MKKGTRIRVAICAVLLVLLVIYARTHLTGQTRTEKEIVTDLIYSYGVIPTLTEKSNQRLLKELAALDPEKAEQWEKIMDFWAASGEDMAISENVLPDGLADGDGLCIIVLGYQLNADGSMRDELIGRLEVAKKSAEKYPQAYILCTGGGTAASLSTTEAEAMAAWLVESGITAQRILTESNSLTTTENAIFCAELLTEQHPEITQVALVSSDYHLPWAAVLFQTKFILDGQFLTLVSNAAYPTSTNLSGASLLRYQASGILEIAEGFLGTDS